VHAPYLGLKMIVPTRKRDELHDIGKPSTTKKKKGRIISYNHDKIGAELVVDFLRQFKQEEEFTRQVRNLVYYHMHILYVLKGLPFADIPSMRDAVDIEEIALLGYCDRMGRLHVDAKHEEKNIQEFKQKVATR